MISSNLEREAEAIYIQVFERKFHPEEIILLAQEIINIANGQLLPKLPKENDND